jgi:formimidoylglutamate deiminase
LTYVFARKALLPSGWADNVRLGIGNGRFESVETGVQPAAGDCVTGCIIPGLANAHSHAFQRALVGRTEERSPAGRDSFWTWRERMYELAGIIDAETLYAIARQAYSEMLEAGYTAVAEFHYLHRQEDTGESDEAMFEALQRASRDSGIRMTYVPVLYERAGFDKPEPEGSQVLFALSADEFLAHFDRVREQISGLTSLGIGAHSLRAVGEHSLQEIARVSAQHGVPLHLHIAEQQREVDQCMAAHHRRPVRWLLENHDVDELWCLVHATHMDPDEVEALANTGAVAVLCPSTEANLGDGLFRLRRFLSYGGRIAIGSDSHVSINPFEELRWLEYGQRLALQSRNVASIEDSHVGRELFLRVLDGGLQASSRGVAGITNAAPADLVALDDDDSMLLGHDDESRLDALVFSGYRLPIERVMVAGNWCVVDGTHVHRRESREIYAAALGELGLAG